MNKWSYTPDPATLVDRLNGIYPSAVGPYAPSPINKDAAAEIVRLRDATEIMLAWLNDPVSKMSKNEFRALLRAVLYNKKPAEAG